MKITAVKPFIVDGGFRPWTFVKVETNEPGLVGWGDCTDWGSPGPVAATVERYAEWVIGRAPMQAEAIWWDLSTASLRHVGGIAWKAMSGIDSALWDIRGKVLGAPVWQLLGGKMRDELRLYWSHCGSIRARHADKLGLPWVKTTDDLRALAEEVKAKGFTAIKTNLMPLEDHPAARPLLNRLSSHAGDCPPDVIRNAELVVGTFRDALGPDVGIALDVAFSFKLGGAIKLARALEPYDLMWLETETLDPDALRTIRESTHTTICHGESLFGTHGYKPFLERHAQDVIMPDFAWNGITMGKKLCDLAQPRPKRMLKEPILAAASTAPGSSVTYRPGMPILPATRVICISELSTLAGASCFCFWTSSSATLRPCAALCASRARAFSSCECI